MLLKYKSVNNEATPLVLNVLFWKMMTFFLSPLVAWLFIKIKVSLRIVLLWIFSQKYLLFFNHPVSRFWLYANPWAATHQASLSFTISWSLLKFMSIASVMPPATSSSDALFSFCPQFFPALGTLFYAS